MFKRPWLRRVTSGAPLEFQSRMKRRMVAPVVRRTAATLIFGDQIKNCRTTMTYNSVNQTQREMLKQCRAESFLDRRVPLGFPVATRPDRGESVISYYMNKHRAQNFGRFYPLHLIQQFGSKQ
jgi:hypothetical protein